MGFNNNFGKPLENLEINFVIKFCEQNSFAENQVVTQNIIIYQILSNNEKNLF